MKYQYLQHKYRALKDSELLTERTVGFILEEVYLDLIAGRSPEDIVRKFQMELGEPSSWGYTTRMSIFLIIKDILSTIR